MYTYVGLAMFLLYHPEGYNTSETVFHWCYVNDLRTTHVVVCRVTTFSVGWGEQIILDYWIYLKIVFSYRGCFYK
jgi:hypothetical protein